MTPRWNPLGHAIARIINLTSQRASLRHNDVTKVEILGLYISKSTLDTELRFLPVERSQNSVSQLSQRFFLKMYSFV